MNFVVGFVTCPDKKTALEITQNILKKGLCACVNILEGLDSYFWWEEKIDNARESLLIIKTSKEKIRTLIREIKGIHSYEVPEIIFLPIIAGNKEYLKWIDVETGRC